MTSMGSQSFPSAAETAASREQLAVLRYFETLNAGEFEATAALFAAEGVLQPPFESPVSGPAAIAAYLQREARGMQLKPGQSWTELVEEDQEAQLQVTVTGQVQTPLLSVNVAWHFRLNCEGQLTWVRINLLASPQQLLGLRR